MKYYEDFDVGDAFESHRTYRVTAEELKSYARQWDPHPYHADESYAKKTLVGQLFAPSMLTLAISTRLSHDTGYYEMSTGGNRSLPTSLCGEWPALSGFERFE